MHTYIWLSHYIGTTLVDKSPHSKLNFNWKVSRHIDFFYDIQFLAFVASRIAKISNVIYEYFQILSNKTANKHTMIAILECI